MTQKQLSEHRMSSIEILDTENLHNQMLIDVYKSTDHNFSVDSNYIN